MVRRSGPAEFPRYPPARRSLPQSRGSRFPKKPSCCLSVSSPSMLYWPKFSRPDSLSRILSCGLLIASTRSVLAARAVVLLAALLSLWLDQQSASRGTLKNKTASENEVMVLWRRVARVVRVWGDVCVVRVSGDVFARASRCVIEPLVGSTKRLTGCFEEQNGQ